MNATLKVQALTAVSQIARPTGKVSRADGESGVEVRVNNPKAFEQLVAELGLQTTDIREVFRKIQEDESLAQRVVEYYEKHRKVTGAHTLVIEE